MISSATREKQKINNAQKKQAVIMESDSQHENSLNEDNNSEEEADMKAKTSQKKNRKRVPVERNLSASNFLLKLRVTNGQIGPKDRINTNKNDKIEEAHSLMVNQSMIIVANLSNS